METAIENKTKLLENWTSIRKPICSIELELNRVYPLREITSKKDYKLGMKLIEHLMVNKENYQGTEYKAINEYMKGLMHILNVYEKEHFPHIEKDISFAELIDDLLDINELKRSDLMPVFGDKSMVSRYLSESIKMNTEHIKKLCILFNCSADLIVTNQRDV